MSHHHATQTHHEKAEEALIRETNTPDGRIRHQNEQNLRAPVAAPEAGLVDAARPEPKAPEALVPVDQAPLMPVPPKDTPKIPQSIGEAANDPVIADEVKDVRVRAEEALATYIHDGLKDKPSLLQGLNLDVLPVVGYGKTGIKLCFHGSHVTTNAVDLNDALIGNNNGLLTKHPVLSKFFHNVAELPKIEATSDNMYHVIIPMTLESYHQTLNALAGEAPQVAAPPVTLPPAQGPLVTPESVQASAAPEVTAAVPQAVVQAPVAALDKAINDNETAQVQGAVR